MDRREREMCVRDGGKSVGMVVTQAEMAVTHSGMAVTRSVMAVTHS